MIVYSIDHWGLTEGKCGLLLFAQSLEELLAPHSHDSHKVPVLNFHYICYEIKTVIDYIEDDILDKGNLIPLMDEMMSLFSKDEIAHEILGDNYDMLFSKKNAKGEYDKAPLKINNTKDVEDSLPKIKKAVQYIADELSRENQYYTKLISRIRECIANNDNSSSSLDRLSSLTRSFASELINIGFTQSYIYDWIKQCFFTPDHTVDSLSVLDDFYSCFTTNEKQFIVYLPINAFKQKRALEEYGNFEIAENIYEMFSPSVSYILKYTCNAIEPYKAQEEALSLINFCLSVSHFTKHNKYDYNPKYSEVVNVSDGNVFFIKRAEPTITRCAAGCETLQISDLLNTCLNMSNNVFQVLQLHSAALISKNTENQLINLWTAVEVSVPIVKKGSISRINQICNTLSTVLCHDYFYVLTHQLLLDIKSISLDVYNQVNSIDFDGTAEEKLLALITLQDFTQLYTDMQARLISSAPILACRLSRYKRQWSDTAGIKRSYIAHSKRISQQIMRIYRTRNMLVHDGTSLPYAEYVLQNLHYYIDSYVKFLSSYYREGYHSVQTAISVLQLKEQQYLTSLDDNHALTPENIVKYIFQPE